MSHKCLRCSAIYQDNDPDILRGCNKCGSIFFLFMKSPAEAQEIKQIEKELQSQNTSLEVELTKKIEEQKSIVAEKKVEEERIPVAARLQSKQVKSAVKRIRTMKFGIETLRIPQEGVYEINIEALMKKRPMVVLEKGSIYLIHLSSAFERLT